MGGKPRLEAMKKLLDKMAEKNIKLIILTNNIATDFIANFITYLHVYDTSTLHNFLQIICARYYNIE
jgi:ribonucleotide monophosphatase NagD (HAD superfamily)